jgi:hypothetical protein
MNVKPFSLTLKNGKVIDNAVSLQDLVSERSDILHKTPINSPDYEAAKKSYNIMAKLYNDKILDVWQIF